MPFSASAASTSPYRPFAPTTPFPMCHLICHENTPGRANPSGGVCTDTTTLYRAGVSHRSSFCPICLSRAVWYRS